MKYWYVTFLFLSPLIGVGQNPRVDSLRRVLSQVRSDTSRVLMLAQLSQAYGFYSADSAGQVARRALELARKIQFRKGEGRALNSLAHNLRDNGEFPQALSYALQAVKIAQIHQDQQGEAQAVFNTGLIYSGLSQYKQALDAFREAEKSFRSISHEEGIVMTLVNRNTPYGGLNQPDSVKWVVAQIKELIQSPSYKSRWLPSSFVPISLTLHQGRLEEQKGDAAGSLPYFRKALSMAYADQNIRSQCQVQFNLAELFDRLHQTDSSLHYAYLTLGSTRYILKNYELRAADLLAKLYAKKGQLDSAYAYQKRAQAANDRFFGRQKFQELQLLLLTEQKRQQELASEQAEYRNQIRFYLLLAGLLVVLLIAFILYRNNRQKHQANQRLNEQKAKVEQALETLRNTQTQLIQREKMASLGELTAGIAHEIQNPLNFVNNFSEVSEELVEEMQEELQKGEIKEAQSIADDIRLNLQKIHHHGKRAGSIVSGMLEHSRTATGERQSTDLNALADEYLRLAYQGLRAKNKDFNCELITDFAPDLGKPEIVPQEIGRVLLNLYNNAFYVVHQRRMTAPADYQPTIWVSTHEANGQVRMKVKDNGMGIPEAIRAKIFQPFFTTKPTGEGTGLGLSLSYDIVTKGHGGTLDVESVEGEGTEFVLSLSLG
jgi:two-component system NtrC family sensor kinase